MLFAAPSFLRHGSRVPETPLILSVPHAGRAYPARLLGAIRVAPAQLATLEDRHVDSLALAARCHETTFVQSAPRAWIDLNRAEHERDPAIDEGADPRAMPSASAKLRSGLGLIPRRVAGSDIWRSRLSNAEVTGRIAGAHRPYHAALEAALAAARARFGIAILLDIHSMPSLGTAGEGAQIVLGDRFGRSAAARLVARIEAEAEAAGLRHALNTPYSGGHILDRHARPDRGIHAIQIEFDRALYLDATLDSPCPAGIATTAVTLRAMIDALTDEALANPATLAAE